MNRADLIRYLYDEIASVLANTNRVSLTDTDRHVGLAREREDYPYPFVAIDHDDGEPRSAGVGAGSLFVDELIFDNQDVLTEIVYRRDTVLTVTVQTLTDGDKELRDELSDALQGHFALLARQDEYDPDIQRLDVGPNTPTGRPESFVYGDGTDLTVEYSTYYRDTDPDAAETVNIDLTAAEDDDGTNGSTKDYTIST